MVKQRMTSLDVRASVEEMRANLVGLRLINLYDIQSKMFLFRFGDSERKKTILVENGVRMHLTSLEREKPKIPSQFTLKLRKHVRAWRLDSITQLSHDRTIDMCFGVASTQGCFHIIVELFSKGNVILTDHTYTIMMLLRTHKDDDVSLVVRGVYPVTAPLQHADTTSAGAAETARVELTEQSRARMLKEDWDSVLARSYSDAEAIKSILSAVKHFGPSLADHIVARTTAQLKARLADAAAAADGTSAHETAQTVALLALLKSNPKKKEIPSPPPAASAATLDNLFDALLPAMLEAWAIAEAPLPPGGYLVKSITSTKQHDNTRSGRKDTAEKTNSDAGGTAEPQGLAAATAEAPTTVADTHTNTQVITSAERYDDFSPVLLAQYEPTDEPRGGRGCATVTTVFKPSFGAVCDTFFLFTETEQIAKHNQKQNKTVLSKREKFERDFQRRVSNLEQEQELNRRKGELILVKADLVDQAIDLINGALAAGIQWEALKQLLRYRHAEGHPVAYMINELLLERNSMTVLLEQELYDDEDDGDVEPLEVEVNLSKTAHANAADYFSRKKANQAKLEKTLAAQDKAAAGADRKGQRVAAKQEAKKQLLIVRTREWWEKMNWFITSAGDIVLQGKDVQTTESLVRRLLRVGDILVHCDVDGALPCVLRPLSAAWEAEAAHGSHAGSEGQGQSPRGDSRQPVAQISLEEAGAWCVSRSSAFEQKNSLGSWWVYASQLTGGTAAGTYLFEGEKHHLTPRPLTLGCALLCRVARDTRTTPPPLASASDADPTNAEAASELSTRCPPWMRYLTPAQLAGASAAAVHADPANELHELPSIEALRPNKPRISGQPGPRQPQPPTAPAHSAAATASKTDDVSEDKKKAPRKTTRRNEKASKGVSRSQLKQERLAAIGERVAIEQAFVAREGEGGSSDDDGSEAGLDLGHVPKASFDPKKPPPPPQLSKHQKKKLKKIQARYADQDEEDRARGALLNGNQLSKIQQRLLEEEAEQERLALLERKALEKEQRAKERKAGNLRYLPGSAGSGDDDEESEVEVVDSFTDEEEEVERDSGNGEQPQQQQGQEQPVGGGEQEEEEEANPAANVLDSKANEADIPASPDAAPTDAGVQGNKARAVTNRDAAHIAEARDSELKAALPFYTPYPAKGDVVHHVVCVCAPLSVLSSYPYSVELSLVSGAKKSQVAEKLLERFKAKASGAPLAEDKVSKRRAAEEAKAEARRAMESSTSTAATTMTNATTATTAAAAANPVVLKALETLSVTDIVEQLRANAAVAVGAARGR